MTTEITTCNQSQLPHCGFGSCHILIVVSMMIGDFDDTFDLFSCVNLCVQQQDKYSRQPLAKRFLSLSPAKSLSNSSYIKSDKSLRNSKTLSVECFLWIKTPLIPYWFLLKALSVRLCWFLHKRPIGCWLVLLFQSFNFKWMLLVAHKILGQKWVFFIFLPLDKALFFLFWVFLLWLFFVIF